MTSTEHPHHDLLGLSKDELLARATAAQEIEDSATVDACLAVLRDRSVEETITELTLRIAEQEAMVRRLTELRDQEPAGSVRGILSAEVRKETSNLASIRVHLADLTKAAR